MKNKLHPQSDFNFWIPVNFEKSKNERTGKEEMKIRGIASTSDEDQEGEELIPLGFELDKFIKEGFVNWNHQAKSDPSKIIGEPTLAKVDSKGRLYVEAKLYDNHPLAKSVWELANTLQKNNSSRKLGWSIEGKALERDPMNPKRITKAKILGVAVTHLPVNANTILEVVKGQQKEDYVELPNEDVLIKSVDESFLYEFNVGDKVYGITKAFDCVEKKAIVPDIEKEETESQKKIKKVMGEFKAGTLKDSHGNKVTDRDQALAIAMSEAGQSKEKAMDTTSTAPLIPESLDPKHKEVLKKAIVNGILPLQNLIQKGVSQLLLERFASGQERNIKRLLKVGYL